MSKDDQQEAFERALSSTLARTMDNLKFAEAKNAALLTFASAWILASNNLVFGSGRPPGEIRAGLLVSLAPLVVAAVLAVRSFLPRLRLDLLHKDPAGDRSLLYFGDIATFAPAAYRQRVIERYMPPEGKSATQAYLDDLAVQIAVVSSITDRKFRSFRWGAFSVLLAVLTEAVLPIVLHVEEACELHWRWANWLLSI